MVLASTPLSRASPSARASGFLSVPNIAPRFTLAPACQICLRLSRSSLTPYLRLWVLLRPPMINWPQVVTALQYTSHSYTYPTQLIDLSPSSSETEVADNDICYIQRLQTYREANILCITNLVQISRLHNTPTPSHALLNSSLNFSTVSRNSFNSLWRPWL